MPTDKNTVIPFLTDDWVVDIHNPGQPGQYTGKSRQAGPHLMVEVRFPDGSLRNRPLATLKPMPTGGASSIESRLESGPWGKHRDFQRLITFEKLKGALH